LVRIQQGSADAFAAFRRDDVELFQVGVFGFGPEGGAEAEEGEAEGALRLGQEDGDLFGGEELSQALGENGDARGEVFVLAVEVLQELGDGGGVPG